MINLSSIESPEEKDDVDDLRIQQGTDSYTFAKDKYGPLMNLLHPSSSIGNSCASPCKVNMTSHVNPNIISGISRISRSMNHVNIGSWIVDFGASDHICSSMKFFGYYRSIAPVSIRFPNGHKEVAKYSGTIIFTSSFIV